MIILIICCIFHHGHSDICLEVIGVLARHRRDFTGQYWIMLNGYFNGRCLVLCVDSRAQNCIVIIPVESASSISLLFFTFLDIMVQGASTFYQAHVWFGYVCAARLSGEDL